VTGPRRPIVKEFYSIHNVVDRDVLQAMLEELAGKIGHRDRSAKHAYHEYDRLGMGWSLCVSVCMIYVVVGVVFIDHNLISSKRRSSYTNSRAYPSADVGSDHQLLIANIRLKVKARRKLTAVKRYGTMLESCVIRWWQVNTRRK